MSKVSTSSSTAGRPPAGNSNFSVQALINRVNSQPRGTGRAGAGGGGSGSGGGSNVATAGGSRIAPRTTGGASGTGAGAGAGVATSSSGGLRRGADDAAAGYTIIDDGAPDPSPQGYRTMMRTDGGGRAAPSLYDRERSGAVYRNPSVSAYGRGSQRVHHTADDITPGRVREIIGGDIRKLGPDDYSVDYRLGMDDGSMRMIGYKFVDERGLRPMIDKWWIPRRYAGTDLQRAAYRAGCY